MGSSYYQELDYGSDKTLIKGIQHKCVCSEHHLRSRLQSDYDSDGTNVYIVKCCCLQFAKEVAATLYSTGTIRNVYLEPKTGLTSVRKVFTYKHSTTI